MAVQVYGVNHVVIEVDNAKKAVEFYSDVFNLEMKTPSICDIGVQTDCYGMMQGSDVAVDQTEGLLYEVKGTGVSPGHINPTVNGPPGLSE